LEADPEFAELRRRIEADPDCAASAVDGPLERALWDACVHDLERRFHESGVERRADFLRTWLEIDPDGIEILLRERLSRLSPEGRERLLRCAAGLDRVRPGGRSGLTPRTRRPTRPDNQRDTRNDHARTEHVDGVPSAIAKLQPDPRQGDQGQQRRADSKPHTPSPEAT
jgi:hypothetical protein